MMDGGKIETRIVTEVRQQVQRQKYLNPKMKKEETGRK